MNVGGPQPVKPLMYFSRASNAAALSAPTYTTSSLYSRMAKCHDHNWSAPLFDRRIDEDALRASVRTRPNASINLGRYALKRDRVPEPSKQIHILRMPPQSEGRWPEKTKKSVTLRFNPYLSPVCLGTASACPVCGFSQSACSLPSLRNTQPCRRRCRRNFSRFIQR